MQTTASSTFQRTLESADALPEEQQQELIEILQHRIVERRRDELSITIREAHADYDAGNVHRGSADDLLRELDK